MDDAEYTLSNYIFVQDEDRIIFRKPLLHRLGMALVGCLFSLFLLWPLTSFLWPLMAGVPLTTCLPLTWTDTPALVVFGLPIWFCFSRSLPEEIFLDWQNNIAQITIGYRPFRYVRRGSSDLIDHLYVRKYYLRGRGFYLYTLLLAWRGRPVRTILAHTQIEDEVVWLGWEISRKMGVPYDGIHPPLPFREG